MSFLFSVYLRSRSAADRSIVVKTPYVTKHSILQRTSPHTLVMAYDIDIVIIYLRTT